MRLLLDDPEMDAQLSRTLIAIAAQAADIGEALATASRTTEVTARKAYLRASEYWRQSFFFIRHDIDDERLQHAWRQHRLAFRAALPLLTAMRSQPRSRSTASP